MLNENKMKTIRGIDTVSRVIRLEGITSWTQVVVLKNYQLNTIYFLSVLVMFSVISINVQYYVVKIYIKIREKIDL